MYKILIGLCFSAAIMAQSCLISRQPQQEIGSMNRQELKTFRTIRVPMLIARPILKAHLKDEGGSPELSNYVNRIKGLSVTVGLTSQQFDAAAFREMTMQAPYQNWMTVNAYGNTVFINAVENNDQIRRVSIAVVAKDEALVYARLKCNFTADELSQLISLLMSDEARFNGWMADIKTVGEK
ncbi:MAG: DUF4252 domain-containing protein [Sphingobacteriales bacterium]|nr:MAG: DUF4252 domain-containing protein [Sphingobacteriales bacterium]